MGISGLIPFLEKASSKVYLKDLRGSTVAVDTYCWLHKGVSGCAEKLVRGEQTDQYVHYCLKYIELLLHYDIKPILVFDGRHLPAKALTEQRRREGRREAKQRAAELLRIGQVEEARSQMRRCVDVTHEMALKLIRQCRLRNVDCIVAPYEADAQLAWLNKVGLAQYVVTEDSDLTLFGASRIIFKLDLTGAGLLVESEKLYLTMGCSQEKFNFDKFRRMCILSGCDYLNSLPGIGLSKACKFMLMTGEDDMWRALKKIPKYLNLKNVKVDDEYIEKFLQAEATFRHMYIYNPLKRRMERLNALDDFQTEERYCCNAGTLLDNEEQALQLALGNLHPFSLEQLDNWHPDKHAGLAQAPTDKNIKRAKHTSIWQSSVEQCTLSDHKVNAERSNSIALFFKKIDFISKTIDEEIRTNEREERAKPGEAELVTMYKQEAADLLEPSVKRRRCISDDDITSPPPSPIATVKTVHNPFAKVQTLDAKPLSAVCENGSLLKLLSPKKLQDESTVRNSKQLNRLRNAQLQLDENCIPPPVEVKSRFFAANVQQVSRSLSFASKADIADEIDKIESLSQQQEQTRAQLYQSPSPKKALSNNVENLSADVEISVMHEEGSDKNAIEQKSILGVNSQPDKGIIVNENSRSSVENVIIISDNDEVAETNAIMTTSITSTLDSRKKTLTTCKMQSQRLGLTRPICTSKSSTKTNKSSGMLSKDKTDDTVKSNQMRLTMFGFQRRPTLKK